MTDSAFVDTYTDAIDEELYDVDKHVDYKWLSNRLSCSCDTAKRYSNHVS
jgi:hypothetical protein